MKAKLLFSLVLLATLGMTSCKKDKEDPNRLEINGKEYPTVTIGNQLWMNANYDGDGGVYFQENGTNKTTYGKYYTLAEAKAIPVPQGWRLPTSADIKKLLESQGAEVTVNDIGFGSSASTNAINKLLSTTGWSDNTGTNASGFNAVPAGLASPTNSFGGQGTTAVFWSSSTYTSNNSTYPIYFYLTSSQAFYGTEGAVEAYHFSVRFVKDK